MGEVQPVVSPPVPHIILIEDNPGDVYLLNVALQEQGVTCRMTNYQTGADALRALCPEWREGTVQLIPDLILMDLNTPCGDGFEVLAAIRANPRLAKVPVAVVTSSVAPADKSRVAKIGGASYIVKPTQLNEFISRIGGAVQELLTHRRPLEATAC